MKKSLQELRIRSVGTAVILCCFLLAANSALGQEMTVSGQVRESGNPLPGVSILEKGTSRGTTSDAQGNFTLTVSSSSSVLVLSFIGYKTQEIPVQNQSTINVDMAEDMTALNEVVVTALGIPKELKSLGYAVQKVDGSSSTKAREPNIMNSLTGKVAGLQIQNQTDLFQNPVILLRGAKPLIVIDGVPSVDGDLWKLNADDIESYNILKGATASALYGSIGRNGVIMITTKRGKAQNKLSVEVNSSTMFQPSFIRIPDVQSTYGNGYNGQYAYVDGSGGGLEGGGWIWGPKLNQPDPSTPSGIWETTQFNSPVDPATGELVPLPFISRGEDNVKNFFRTGLISTNNISVTGGGENGNFRASVSNTYQRGIVPNTQLNNTSFSIAGGYQLSKKLKSDASITYNRQYTDNFPEVNYGPENYLYNLVLWTGPDIDVRDLRNYWVKGQEDIQQNHYNKSWYNNPYFQAYEFLQGYYKDNVFGQLTLNYNVIAGLDLTLRTGFNQYSLNRDWKTPKSYVRYDIYSLGNYDLESQNELNINTDFIAQYTRKISNNFTLKASVGGANRWRTYKFLQEETDGLIIPGFYNLSNSRNPLRGENSIEEEKVNSIYGTLDAELFGGIFLGVTGRNDWVSTLPLQNNSFFYPSVSLSVALSEFVDLTPYSVSFLKLRGSWSRVSDGKYMETASLDEINDINDPNSTYPYKHIQAYDPGVNWNNNPSVSFPKRLINPDLKPETSNTYEIGMDARFLDGRLGLDLAVYRINDSDILYAVPMSEGSGYTERLENGIEASRRGLEITLSATPVKNTQFSWDVVLNWSRFRKYLESIYGGAKTLDNVPVGTRYDQIYAFSYMHTPDGRLVLQDNGFPQDDPYPRMLGYKNPDFIFGFLNTFTYKNFSLTVSIDGRIGGKMYSTTNQKMWWGGTHPGTVNAFRDDANEGLATYVADGVVVTEGDVQYDSDGNIISDTRVYAPNTTAVNYIAWNINTSNAFLNHYYDASFVKLREVTLTYNFPQSLLSKTVFNTASLSFVGRNLALWSDMHEVDPDAGTDNLQTPSTRSIGFNLNFSF